MTESELYTLLSTDADIVSIVGAEGVYNGWLPENKPMPAVTFYFVSGAPDSLLEGYDGTHWARYSLNVWAKDGETADALRLAVIAAMQPTGWPCVGELQLSSPEEKLYRYAIDYSILR